MTETLDGLFNVLVIIVAGVLGMAPALAVAYGRLSFEGAVTAQLGLLIMVGLMIHHEVATA